jgi:hypothetical protein
MTLTPAVTIHAEVAVNSNSATYVTAPFDIATANLANGSTFRMTVGGFVLPTSANGQAHTPAVTYTVYAGAAGTVSDNVIYTTTQSVVNNSFFKDFLLTLRANGANATWIAGAGPSAVGTPGGISNATVNSSSTAGNYIGVGIQLASGTDETFGFVELAVTEQLA